MEVKRWENYFLENGGGMDKFKVGDMVIDNNEKCAPRKVVMYFCEHCKKEIKGLLGTTDNMIIALTEYNKGLYKAREK